MSLLRRAWHVLKGLRCRLLPHRYETFELGSNRRVCLYCHAGKPVLPVEMD